jgi:hypothetical protein
MKHAPLFILLLTTVLLTGCVDRKAADAKLKKGCIGAINAFLEDDDKVKSVKNETFRDYTKHSSNAREISMDVEISDGFHARDESHSCVFLEEFSFGRLSHNASIYQLNLDGKIIGQENYQIQGTLEDMQKLTAAVEDAMR